MKRLLKRLSFRQFLWLDRLGVHVLPKHYYTPIPDFRWLRRNREHWIGRVPLTGIHWDLDTQLCWLGELVTPFRDEVLGLRLYHELGRRHVGPGYGPIESQVLHCFLRAKHPRTIVEIGSGLSTHCAAHAVELNVRDGRTRSRIVCIEPYPSHALEALPFITLRQETVQSTPSSLFEGLEGGDLLFVDSSHSVKTGSDVLRIFLEIVPRLPPGVFIHVHDIYLPYVYHRTALSDYLAPQETALVLALLINNQHLGVLACLSALHHDRPEALRALLPDYQPQSNDHGLAAQADAPGHFPSSLWLLAR